MNDAAPHDDGSSESDSTELQLEQLQQTVDELYRACEGSQDPRLATLAEPLQAVSNRIHLNLTYPRDLNALVENFHFEEQYHKYLQPQYDCGLIEDIGEGRKGVVVQSQGKKISVPVPAFGDHILQSMKNNPELLATLRMYSASEDPTLHPTLKVIAWSNNLDRFFSTLGEATTHHKSQLRIPGGAVNNAQDRLILKREDEPVWQWREEYDDPDNVIYFPVQYAAKHGGRTKQQILDEDLQEGNPHNSLVAFHVFISDGTNNVPRKGQETVTGKYEGITRTQLPGGTSARTFLSFSKNDRRYKGECGDTLESVMTDALVHMQRTKGEVIGDYANGRDCAILLPSVYLKSSGCVGSFDWRRGDGRFGVGGYDPGDADSGVGVRPAVRVS